MGPWRPDRQDLAGRRDREGIPGKGAIQTRMRAGSMECPGAMQKLVCLRQTKEGPTLSKLVGARASRALRVRQRGQAWVRSW